MPASFLPRVDAARTAVEAVIVRHVGREQAISIDQIAAVTGFSAREIKQCVHDLRLRGIRIGSSRSARDGANPGYYMLATQAELSEFLREYLGQAKTEMRLVQAMLRSEFPPLVALEQQLALDLPRDVHA